MTVSTVLYLAKSISIPRVAQWFENGRRGRIPDMTSVLYRKKNAPMVENTSKVGIQRDVRN